MRRSALSTVLVILAIVICGSLFSPAKAARDEAGAYTAKVSIKGLPESVSTTVYLDGELWGRYRGGVTLTFLFTEGSTHTVSVDRIVNVTSGVSYVCESNVATFLMPGPEYPFNYAMVEPIPELNSPILATLVLASMVTIIGVYMNRFRTSGSARTYRDCAKRNIPQTLNLKETSSDDR
jgi:hypothetical protein